MISIDFNKGCVIHEDGTGSHSYPLNSLEAFALVSDAWLRAGWDNKYVYSFTWLGRPIIQLPEDMFRVQEVIYRVKPDVIIETGVAHGGSLIFYASLLKAMGRGRVIGVDIEIRPQNRKAISSHELSAYISLVEGGSTHSHTIQQVKSLVSSDSTVLVILDSSHTKDHVFQELIAYSSLVTVGSYVIACDGIMEKLVGAPRSCDDWSWNNPKAAVREFLTMQNDFVLEQLNFPFNEGNVRTPVTYWPDAFLRRIR